MLSSTLGMPDTSTLLGDMTQLRNDLTAYSAALVNAVQPSQANTPTRNALDSQGSRAWTILAADWNNVWQDAVRYEDAVLATAHDWYVTLLDDFFVAPSAQQEMPSVATPPDAVAGVGGTGSGAATGGKTPPVFSPKTDGPGGPNLDPTRTASGGLGADINGVYGSGSFNGSINSTSFDFTTSGQLTSPPYTAYSGTLSGTVSGTQLYGTFHINNFTGTVTGSFTPLNTNNITINGSYSGSDGNGNTISGGFSGTISGPLPFPPAAMAQHLCNCGRPGETGSLLQTSTTLSGSTIPQTIPASVRYSDGVADIAATDLHSDGFGFPWGQTRTWSNDAGYPQNNDNGNGWVDTYTPYLLEGGPSSVIFIANGNTAYYYDNGMGGLQPRFNDGSQLSYNGSNDTYTLLDTQGDQIVLAGFGSSRPMAQQGQRISFTDPYGHTTAVTSYTSDGHIAEMQRSTTSNGNTTIESWLFSYLSTGDAGTLGSLTLRTQVNGGTWTTVRQVQYSYYGVGAQHGNPGDLMTATVLDGSGNVLDTSYYRYYTPGQANGYAEGLEFVFNPDSYLRLTAALGTNLSNLADAQVAPYADNYFQYDSQQRVTLETVQGSGDSQTGGGLGTYTFSYSFSSNAAGFNSWAAKTLVTNPDGSTDTVYTNYVGEVMLDDHYSPNSGLHTDQFYAYNSNAQLALMAAPSAVSGYNDTYADLLNNQNGTYQYLNNSSGLITYYDYYTMTTAGETMAGGVANYLQDEQIQQGQQGTLIPQETWQYYAHAYNGQTIAPIATDTVYRNSDGTGAETTSYAYTWFTNTAQIQSETDTAPVIAAAQNGPGTADVTTTYFDQYGNAQWIQDADGYIQYYAYDAVTGALLTQIVDVNTADTSEFTNLPSGWTTPSGGGLNLVTTDQVDALGRTTEETSPAGNITYYVYLDPQHEERIYNGWNSSTGMPTGPTVVIRHDATDSYDEVFTMTAAPHLTNGAPDGSEAISGLQTLTRDYTNAAGQVIAEDKYFNLGGLAYTTGAMGTVNVNYYQTQYGYDSAGRLVRTQTPNGAIYRTVYNSLDEVVSDWVGTNDTPTSGEWSPSNNTGTANMVEVRSYQYDNGGVGDGNLTQVTDYPGLGAAPRVTDYWYDWRDRLVAVKSGVQSSENDGVNRPIIVTTYDNLDGVIETQQYAGDGVTPQIVNGVLQALDPSLLRAQEIDSYDDQGRLYQTQVFDVNPTTGAVSTSALTTNYYYDHRGNRIAESAPGGLWTKSVFDGAGHDVLDYTTDGGGGTSWAAAGSVANDTVLEQVQTVYDGDGNAIETIASQRFHNATGTGSLGNPTSGIGARVYYAAAYYDNADRLIASVDAGTNGGTAWTRPTLLVTTYAYNSMGLVQDVTDPMGIVNRTYYDNLGRTIQTIQDYTNGTETAESNISTEYGYDGNNNVLYVQADEPGGSYQKTAYVYGVTTASGSGVNSNDILSAVQHPDPTTGQLSSSQQDSYLVNALGEVVQSTDRNGNVHQYSYDVLGRLTSDAVTTLGAGVDGTVRQITYGYDSQGNLSLITSYNAASGGSIVNQVQRVYNGLGQLTGEYQSHSGAVVPGSTPEVQYAYNEMSNGENNSRLVSMTYPSGYVLNYNYNTGLDDSISRLSSISDSTGVLEAYKYLGLDTVVERDHPQNNVNQTYIAQPGQPQTGDAGDQYTGLDRFGRVVDQNWVNATTGVSTDNFQYGYNPDGDVLYKQNLVDAVMSELYQYDNLHQLIYFARGTLNSTDTAIVGTPSASQSWSPDALGNFNSVTTNGSTQTRTANQQNEITSISGAGAVTYDANGNLTADGSGNTYVYDAWNRLVAVKNGGTTVASYGYDGLGRRITETHGSTTTDLYLSSADQVLEEDVGGVVQARNVWGPEYVNELILRDQSSQHNGVLDQRLYVQQDANWNVTALVDTSGNVLERYAYDPYGAVTVLTSNWFVQSSSAYNVPYGFQDMRTDPATGSPNAGPRDDNLKLMAWQETDPLGLLPGNNDHQFEGNGPTTTVDPSGLEPPPDLIGGWFRRPASRSEYTQWVMRNYQTPAQRETMLGLQPMLQLEQLALVPQAEIGLTRFYLGLNRDLNPLYNLRYKAALISLHHYDPSLFEGRGSLQDEYMYQMASLTIDGAGALTVFAGRMRLPQTKMTLSMRNGKMRVTVEDIPCPSGNAPNRGSYLPTNPATRQPIPLRQQTVNGVDIPLPEPLAGGRPHTTLGARVGSDGVLYRQSATFPGETWPQANGQNVPWSRVDWTGHPGLPGPPHPNPHQHIFWYDRAQRSWMQGGPTPFNR